MRSKVKARPITQNWSRKVGGGVNSSLPNFGHALCTVDIKCTETTESLINSAISLEFIEFGVLFRFHRVLVIALATARYMSAGIDVRISIDRLCFKCGEPSCPAVKTHCIGVINNV